MPWYVETRVLYYRTDLAEEGGFNQAPATWDELTQLAQANRTAAPSGASACSPAAPGRGRRSCRSSGRPAARSSTPTTTSRSTPRRASTALTYYDSFFENGLAQPSVSDVPVEAQFADGTVGAFISGPWMIGLVTDAGADPETWTVAHQPTETSRHVVRRRRQPRRVRAVRQQGRRLGVRRVRARGPRSRSTWYETVSDLPAVQAAWDDPALADDELLAAFGEQLEDAKSPPAIPTWEEVASAIDGQIEQVTQGDTSPEDGCAAMQEEAESIGTGL